MILQNERRILRQPNYSQTWQQFDDQINQDLILTGNAFAFKDLDDLGETRSVWRIDPVKVMKKCGDDGYYVNCGNGTITAVTSQQMLEINK